LKIQKEKGTTRKNGNERPSTEKPPRKKKAHHVALTVTRCGNGIEGNIHKGLVKNSRPSKERPGQVGKESKGRGISGRKIKEANCRKRGIPLKKKAAWSGWRFKDRRGCAAGEMWGSRAPSMI